MISRSHRRCGGESKNSFTLVENNNTGEVFDPTITTSVSTTLVWSSSNGYSTVTTGTTHDVSYTAPANGPRRWTITCAAGLSAIKTLDMNTDKLERIDISLLRSLAEARAYINASLSMSLRDLPIGLTYASFFSDLLLTGDIADLPIGLTNAYLNNNPFLTAGSVSGLTKITDLRVYSIGWDAESVDTVLLSISDAIHADPTHFTYATPSLQIGGSNLAPGGTPAAATTSPLTTPGSGNSDSDWEWDAVAGKHKALTGMAAIWVMRNNTGHVWTVTATGVV